MIFDKAEEYLFDIFANQEIPQEFQICSNSKKLSTLGGYLDNGDAYLLKKGKNKIGLRINNGKYSFIQHRQKLINAPEFQYIIENDEYITAEDFRNLFKDVDYVQFIECDQDINLVQQLSYLVNKSTYVLINYFNQSSPDDRNSATLNSDYINAISFFKFKLSSPANPFFDIRNLDNITLFISENHQSLYDITLNDEDLENENLRIKFINKIYSTIIDADKNSYILKDDLSYCIDSVSQKIENENSDNELDDR